MKKSCLYGSWDHIVKRWLRYEVNHVIVPYVDHVRVERLSEGYVVRARAYSDYMTSGEIAFFVATTSELTEMLARLDPYLTSSGE